MNAMKNKIKSPKGASITFALLLFLVCSVVSIVVVVAGSAAAGRMSQRAETDQRYYAVTSAVELLCNDFKGMKVTVEYSKAPTATAVPESAVVVKKIVAVGDSMATDVKTDYTVLAGASKQLVCKIANAEPAMVTTDPDDTLTLTGGPEGAALGCAINEYVKRDGRVIFEVSNAEVEGAAKQNIYTLQAVLNANISQSRSQYKTAEGTTMEKVTVTLVWSVNSIEKGAVS